MSEKVESLIVSYDFINEMLLVGEQMITRTKAINMFKGNEAFKIWNKLVPFDFDHADIEVVIAVISKEHPSEESYLLIGRKENGRTKIMNTIKGNEAINIWNLLKGPKKEI